MRIATRRRGDRVAQSSTSLSLSPRSGRPAHPSAAHLTLWAPGEWRSGMSGPAARTWPRLQGAERPRAGLPAVPGTSSWGQIARPRGPAHSRDQEPSLTVRPPRCQPGERERRGFPGAQVGRRVSRDFRVLARAAKPEDSASLRANMASSPPKMGGSVRERGGETKEKGLVRRIRGRFRLSVSSGVTGERWGNRPSFEPCVSGGNRRGGNY